MPTSILTIDPGSRYWGISVFHGRTLIASFTKSLSTKGTPRNRVSRARKAFLTLYRKHMPEVLFLGKPLDHWKDQSPYLEKIIREIKQLARREQIRVVEFSPQEVGKRLCNNERVTKEELSQTIGRHLPELKKYLLEDQKDKDQGWRDRAVKSIALCIFYFQKYKKT
jgi:hypothetical protein